jgi:hypothetical protein
MNLLETKEITVGDVTLYIKLTMRSMIEYEKLSGSNIIFMSTTENLVQYLYCTAKAGAKDKGIPFNYTYDTFLDYIDELDYTQILTKFTAIMSETSNIEESKKARKTKK